MCPAPIVEGTILQEEEEEQEKCYKTVAASCMKVKLWYCANSGTVVVPDMGVRCCQNTNEP